MQQKLTALFKSGSKQFLALLISYIVQHMKKWILYVLLGYLFFSCQKEIHWDLQSKGFLAKDSIGNCFPVTANGEYVEDSATGNNNFLMIDVNVIEIGIYNIYTDSINGLVFKATGEFNTTGINHVKLLCSGKPIAADTNYFMIHYDSSFCEAVVIVKSNAIPPAVFTLSGAPAKCMDYIVQGTYRKYLATDTSNTVNVHVDVSSPGRYDIITDTVNGYWFTGSGIFTAAGIQSVDIYSNGTPMDEGTNVFTLHANGVVCNFNVDVNSDEAKFTLQGSPGKCMNDTVIGTYVKRIGLDTFSKVNVEVNVTLPGTYALVTDTVNGYSFKGYGSFTATGQQTVTMYAVGYPLLEGTDIFTVSGSASSCSFEVKVLAGLVIAPGQDYFPLTDSSYWIYNDLFYNGTSIKRTISGASDVNGHTYKVMRQTDRYSSKEYLFRKEGGDYLEYAKADKYTEAFHFKDSIFTEHLFLKENITQNQGWESPEFQGASTFNQVLVLKYSYKCLKRDAVVTVNGKAFANVFVIEMRPLIRSINNPWSFTNEVYTYYYAKGIGLIYLYAISNAGYLKAQMELNTWLVN